MSLARKRIGAAGTHELGCGCADCVPPGPAGRQPLAPPDTIARACVAGVVVGLVLVWLLDRFVGGPGVGVMFQ